jgi:uncharacterized membrane protein SirB2
MGGLRAALFFRARRLTEINACVRASSDPAFEGSHRYSNPSRRRLTSPVARTAMIEFYPDIKWVHISSVLASGLLFLMRGSLVLAGRERIAMFAPLRYLSYTIDTVLLTAALMLMSVLKQYPFVDHWLTVKVVLLVGYIVLGSMALRRASSRSQRAAYFVAALATFAMIYGVARAHHPLGPFLLLG